MRTRVKICGITNLIDALRAAKLGADFLGFNFCKESLRYIDPGRAKRIVARLPRKVKAVGIFVDAPPSKIDEIARQTGVKIVQLHGSEPPRAVAALAKEHSVWKVVRVRRTVSGEHVRRFRAADALLLDSYGARVKGGTGETFDWRLAQDATKHARIILAGGLTPENVGEAIRHVRPWAVDVASGIEVRPGKKSLRKMRAFVQAVRAAKVR